MKIRFLGTSGWFDSEAGETPCTFIDAQEAYIVLDAGNAIRKIDRHIEGEKPIYVFLSHFHLDHISGLHMLMKFKFDQGITIIGQPGTKEILEQILRSPFTAPLEMVRGQYPVRVEEVSEGKNAIGRFDVDALPLLHRDTCFGYSFLLEGKRISYCTDTGICDNLAALAKDADLLITECSWKQRNQSPAWPHLAPEDAASVASRARAKLLALVHFDSQGYPTIDERMEAGSRAKAIFSNTMVAYDDLEIEI